MAHLHELKNIFKSEQLPENIHGTLSGALLGDLNHTQHHLRCAVLAVIPIVRPHGIESDSAVFDTVCRYSMDSHPKVRQQALNVILHQHLAGVELPVEMYDECVVATKDDFEQVRLVAVELVWAISSVYPEHPVVIHKYKVTETIRLLDDAFVKLCDMVNDSSTVVRQRACAILGRFKNVDIKFLSQTFSKQVMSHLRRFVPRGPRGRGRGRGSKGQPAKSHIPTPEGDADVESDEFKLLDSGAAGAFVHGLEDEFQEVRDAAIESITELSGASAEFAGKAVDFLVDMFNDSSDRVRQCAIRALLAIGTRTPLSLTEEQMLIAVSAMKDASGTVRHGIYGVLGVSILAKPEWMETLMEAFKANLERYPDDQMPIYKALQALGRRHPTIITSHEVVRNLLGISRDYLNREPRLDDVYYAGVVILVMNAPLESRLTLHRVLPEFVYSHLPYLRDKYPDCMP
ncbi:ARM repeat-containing protein, partial [Linderina pennispora]